MTTYRGSLLRGLPHGDGSLVTGDGAMRSTYDGTFVDGRRHGSGRASLQRAGPGGSDFEALSHYTGDWQADRYHGHGAFQDAATADSYTGGWVDGKREGDDCIAIEYGRSHYVGSFRNDVKHGRGLLKFNNGGQYAGEFANGIYHGRGRLTLADGVTAFDGDFVNGHCSGKATVTLANGNVYSGTVECGVIQGEGEMKYTNGDVYIGCFVAGERRGAGALEFAGGGRLVATWNASGNLDGTAAFYPPTVPSAPAPTRREYRDGSLIREEPLQPASSSPWANDRPTDTPTRPAKANDGDSRPAQRTSQSLPGHHYDCGTPTTGVDRAPVDRSSSSLHAVPAALHSTDPTPIEQSAATSTAGIVRTGSTSSLLANLSNMQAGSPTRSYRELRGELFSAELALADATAQLETLAPDDPARRDLMRRMALLRATRLRVQRRLKEVDDTAGAN